MDTHDIYKNTVKALRTAIINANNIAKNVAEDKNSDNDTEFTRYWDNIAVMVAVKKILRDSGFDVQYDAGMTFTSASTGKIFTTIKTIRINGITVLDNYNE